MSATMEFVNVTKGVPAFCVFWLYRPPPASDAELLAMVALSKLIAPLSETTPPPRRAELSYSVEFWTVALASARTAKWMRSNVPGVHIPDHIIKRLEGAEDQKAEGKRLCIDIINEVKEIAGVSGVHVMAYRQEEYVAEIVHDSGVLKGRKPWRKEPNFANEAAEARLEDADAAASATPHALAGAAAESEA